MTTRYNTLTVVFDEEIREDDLDHWINAIRMLRKVIDVQPGGSGHDFEHARTQAISELRKELREVLWKF